MVNRASRPERGLSTLEMVITLAVLGFLASSVVVVESRDFRFARESHDRAAALRACAARLEEYAGGAAAPAAGERTFDLPPVLAGRFPGAVATESVRTAAEGLLEVVVRVRWRTAGGGEVEARLATLVATEAGR
jgi:type II secretory pathway pseudopilin PulG